MKKLALVVVGMVLSWSASADVTFTPSTPDLFDLNHDNCYVWNIDLSQMTIPENGINSAQLTLKYIYDYTGGVEGDALSIQLLDGYDTGSSDIATFADTSTPTSNYFDGTGTPIAHLEVSKDIGIGGLTAKDIVINFDPDLLAALNTYAADGSIAIAFDPDCHFFNHGVQFSMSVVPAPGAILLTGIGTILAGWMKRRRSL